MSLHYEKLSPKIESLILEGQDRGLSPFACREEEAFRRDPAHDKPNALRTPFIRDVDKIIHCPYFNRYADKTQVFSFYKNDDITRRSLHVQLVSRIARTIGRALGLNQDLIEAIALGHDLGHTPFGHVGEAYLDELLFERTGLHFCHNLHSVRVLDKIFPYNITLQTLDGIACHNGELELDEYRPAPLKTFGELDALLEDCAKDKRKIKEMIPSTLEGCVVRISDIIAYLGKDRQDAKRAKVAGIDSYKNSPIGIYNAEIINNLCVNLVENSIGKPYLKLDQAHFKAMVDAKRENYERIYEDEVTTKHMDSSIRPMMEQLYDRLVRDLEEKNQASPIFRQHIRYVGEAHYQRSVPYESEEPALVAADYIASMTNDYFVDLYAYLFPESPLKVDYIGYF